MQPLIQAHTVGPRPLSRPGCARGAGGIGAESILQRLGTVSVLGGWGTGRGVPTGGSCGTSVLFGILASLGALFGGKQRRHKILFLEEVEGL